MSLFVFLIFQVICLATLVTVSCGMQDLYLWHVGSNSWTVMEPTPGHSGHEVFRPLTAREVPQGLFK